MESYPPLGVRESFLEHIIFKLSPDSKVGVGRSRQGGILNIKSSMCKGLEVKTLQEVIPAPVVDNKESDVI